MLQNLKRIYVSLNISGRITENRKKGITVNKFSVFLLEPKCKINTDWTVHNKSTTSIYF